MMKRQIQRMKTVLQQMLKSIINKYREPVSVEQLFKLAYSDDEKQ